MYNGYGLFGGFWQLFPVFFIIIFLLIISVFIIGLVRGISQWNSNNHSPVLTVNAMVVTKRQNVTHHHRNHGAMDTMNGYSTSTSYYATFQVESGDRMELSLSGKEYGLLAEGDVGRLTFQGTRYLGFERESAFAGGSQAEESFMK